MLLSDAARRERLEVVFPSFVSVQNPLILSPFRHKSRPLYPVRAQERVRCAAALQRF